jgi:beta-lactamase class A
MEPKKDAESLRGAGRSTGRRLPKRAAAGRRSFTSTLKALDDLAASGAKISVRITDLDRGTSVLSGDDFVTLPVAGLGVVPLLIEVAAAFESGRLEPLEIIDRAHIEPVGVGGVWQHLKAPALPLKGRKKL